MVVHAVQTLANVPNPTSTTVNLGALLAPILSTGLVGIFLLMLLFKIKVMPSYVYDDAKEVWDKDREKFEKDIADLKEANTSLRTLTENQIIPALVRANQLSADYATDLADERRRRNRGKEE